MGLRFAIVMAVTDAQADPHRRASMIHRAGRHAGLPPRAQHFLHGARGRRLGQPRRASVRGLPCSPREPAGRPKGPASRWPRPGWARDESSTACAGSASAGDRSSCLCERAARRELAPGELLGSRQTVENWIAESRAAIDAARLLVLHAAWTIDSQGIAQAREAISLIKFHVAGVMQEVIDRAVQAHGALGISDDLVLSWFYRQERAARIYDGPDEVHKVVVAKRMLKSHERGQP